jgi:hypothetical protein
VAKRRLDKERENAAALEVLPDLLKELDAMTPHARLTSLIEGVLAANIFDWGAKACVDLYHNGTILEIYRWGCCAWSCSLGMLLALQAAISRLQGGVSVFLMVTCGNGPVAQGSQDEAVEAPVARGHIQCPGGEVVQQGWLRADFRLGRSLFPVQKNHHVC